MIILGRLTADPKVSTSGKNTTIARFSLAVNRQFKKEGETDVDYFNCVCFGKSAEFVEKYFRKGSQALVCGKHEMDSYTDKDGSKKSNWSLKVETIEFAGSKNDGTSKNTVEGTMEGKSDFMNIPDESYDELPFT